tara:strand:+ start:9 stop:1013 length:1005 start_codon:yes stop_codon:yes gene_type:complete
VNDPFKKYKDLYRDIIFGYSEFRLESNKNKIFVKHLNELETGESERKFNEFLYTATESGLKTEEESVAFLIAEGAWSEENEQQIKELTDKLSQLHLTKSKLLIKSQLALIQEEIEPIEKELTVLNYERQESMGMTAETFANKKISELTLQRSMFKDRELKELYYTEEEFDYLGHEEVNECLGIYTEMISEKFQGDEIKRVAVSPFFMNAYIICDDNVYNFFGRPILTLTNFQLALMSQAKYLKNLMSNHKSPPEDFQATPDKIIEWYELQSKSSEAMRDMENKGEGGGKSVFGATRDELSSMETNDEKSMNLSEEIEKHGGEMNFDEILKMHGM